MPTPARHTDLSAAILDQVTRALRAVGAEPQKAQVDPINGQGLLITTRIRDQVVSTLIPAGFTADWDEIADTLVMQLHEDNQGLPNWVKGSLQEN